jgi:hypothetical protein
MNHPKTRFGNKVGRFAAMVADLHDPVILSCSLDPGGESIVSTDGGKATERIGISGEKHLASFNLLKNGKVAVPG